MKQLRTSRRPVPHQGFADARQLEQICRHLPPAMWDTVRFMFITGWQSLPEVLPMTWGQVDFAAGFVRLESTCNRTDAWPMSRQVAASSITAASPFALRSATGA